MFHRKLVNLHFRSRIGWSRALPIRLLQNAVGYWLCSSTSSMPTGTPGEEL